MRNAEPRGAIAGSRLLRNRGYRSRNAPYAVETFLRIVTSNIDSACSDSHLPMIPIGPWLRMPCSIASTRASVSKDGRTVIRSRVVLIGQDMPAKPIRDLFDVLAPRSPRKQRRLA